MDIFEQLNQLNQETLTTLVDTGVATPEEYRTIYLDVKEELRKIWKQQKSFLSMDKVNTQMFERSVLIAGGSLSECVMENYNEKAKDLDIFVALETARIHKTGEEVAKILSETVGTFASMQSQERIPDEYGGYFTVVDVVQGTHKNYPDIPVEIVFTSRNKLEFDLTIKEFYSYGDRIYGTNKAMQGLEKKEIMINTVSTPLQSMLRAKEFSKRYDYSINQENWNLILRYLKVKNPEQKIEDTWEKMKKYKDEKEYARIIKEIEKVEELDSETYRILTNTPSGVASVMCRQAPERAALARQKGMELEKGNVWQIGKVINEYSEYKHKKHNTPVSVEIHQELIDFEKKLIAEKKMVDMFTKEYEDKEKYVPQKIDNMLKQKGYEYKNPYIKKQVRYAMLKLDQISLGLTDGKEMMQVLDELEISYGKPEDIKKAVQAEQVVIRLSKETCIWDKKCDYQSPQDKHFSLQISFGENNQHWGEINVREIGGRWNFEMQDKFIYAVGERYDQLKEIILEGLGKVKSTPSFDYSENEITKMFDNNFPIK